MCWIKAGGGCVKVVGIVWNTLKWGGTEKRGGSTKILKRGGEGKLGQGVCLLKGGEAGTPLQTMIYYLAVVFLALVPNLYLNKKTK